MKQLANWFQQHQPKQILDVATGVGNFIHLIKSVYNDYESIIGIDTSTYAVDSATKNITEDDRVSFLEMDGNNTSFTDGQFDLVTLSNSLHHLAEPTTTFDEMKRLVRPGGHIIVSEMIANDLTDAQVSHLKIHHFAAEIDRYLGDVHNETYTEEELLAILSDMPGEIDTSWPLSFQRQSENTDEEINWLKSTLDRLVARVKDNDMNAKFQQKANTIKEYMNQHGFDSATTIIVVMTV